MKYIKDPTPVTSDEVSGIKRVVAFLEEELAHSMNRKRRSILNHVRKFLVGLNPGADFPNDG